MKTRLVSLLATWSVVLSIVISAPALVLTADAATMMASSSSASGQVSTSESTGISLGLPGTDSGLLQFTSAGHVLGFSKDGVAVASASHMLKVAFLNSNAVIPEVDNTATGSSTGTAPALSRVTYRDVWDGVTVVYEASDTSIAKSTYYVDTTKDGTPVDSIRLGYNRPVQIDESGNLVISYEDGTLTEGAPVAWQETEGGRRLVTAAYVLRDEREVGFSFGDYVKGIPVIIDPEMVWNTFLGGSGNDYPYAMAVDGSGNVYAGGGSNATWGSPVRAFTGGWDAFVAKLDSSGNLLWNTFLGGTDTDQVFGIAVDGSGNVYVSGYSKTSWGSPADAFAAKLDSSGNLQWNSFLGGSGNDYGNAIAVDGSGNVYVGGYSDTTWGSPVRAFTGGGYYDAFAAKLDSNGTLQWNTFLGGSDYDIGNAIAVDGSGNVYVGGTSNVTWGSPVRSYISGYDAFAAKLDTSGTLQWNTFLGGSANDYGNAIAVDGSGSIYVGGTSDATWGSPVRSYSGSKDAFVAKLDSSGILNWNTFLGGSDYDWGNAMAVDGSGNVYVSGYSMATWGSPVQNFSGGTADAMAAMLNSSGNLTWNTFLGGSGEDGGSVIAVDGSGNVYVSGYSPSTWGSPVRSYTSGHDVFVAKLDYHTPPANQDTVFSASVSKQGGASVPITSSGDANNNVWFAPSGTTAFVEGATMTRAASGTATTILAPATEGTYHCYVTDAAGNISAASAATLTVDNTPPTNQDIVFGTSVTKQGSTSVMIVSSGDATNNVWFAPAGTTTFVAGTTMTRAASGTATTILAPATEGTYRCYVVDAAENASAASTATLTIDNAVPTVTTQAITNVADTTAIGNGTVVSDGGSSITERGIVWNTGGAPTTADSKATASGTTGAYVASITSLTAGTVYHVRAYAINAIGTSYGVEVTFNIGWMPFTPVEGSVIATPTTAGGTTTMNVSITFSSSGYRVDDWGLVTKVGEDYRVDAIVSRWTGPSIQMVNRVNHAYSLGALSPGSHNFSFYANGTLVKTTPFVVAASTPAAHSIAVTSLLATGTPSAGKAVLVQMTVENKGRKKGTFTVELSAGGKTVGKVTVKDLAPGKSRKLYLRWTPAVSGEVTLAATVVSDGISLESAPGVLFTQKIVVRR